MIAAGWSRRPFDVAPDRTFRYDGIALRAVRPSATTAWQERLAAEVKRLGTVFRQALAVDGQTIGSPVYQTLRGLRPADWSAIETARAKYFEGILDDWQARVRIARRYGRAGDVLTLARDAPTRFHRGKLMLEAARALVELQRFDVAESVLAGAARLGSRTTSMRCASSGSSSGRLGRTAEAEQRIAAVLEQTARPSGGAGRARADPQGRVARDVERRRRPRRAAADRPQVGGPGATRDPQLPPRPPAGSRVVLQRDQRRRADAAARAPRGAGRVRRLRRRPHRGPDRRRARGGDRGPTAGLRRGCRGRRRLAGLDPRRARAARRRPRSERSSCTWKPCRRPARRSSSSSRCSLSWRSTRSSGFRVDAVAEVRRGARADAEARRAAGRASRPTWLSAAAT